MINIIRKHINTIRSTYYRFFQNRQNKLHDRWFNGYKSIFRTKFLKLDRYVSVIIPICDDFMHLTILIPSLLKYTSKKTKIFLINDNSTDINIPIYLNKLKKNKNISVIENERRLGFSGTINRGMSYVTTKYAIWLNSDTIVTKHWVNKLVKPLYLYSNAGSATPFSNSASVFSYSRNIEYINGIPTQSSINKINRAFEHIIDFDFKRNEIPTGHGFCMCVSTECFKQTGKLDADTFGEGYGEENDWCIRASKIGWHHFVAPNLYIYHFGGSSFGNKKAKLLSEHMEIINKKYPFYLETIKKKFFDNSPWKYYFRIANYYLPNRKILLISHELSYTGAPTSLLRIAKILKKKHDVIVWSYFDGPFKNEFKKNGIEVEIISKNDYYLSKTKNRFNEFSFVICNTSLTTDAYKLISPIIPSILYIREAKNIKTWDSPDFKFVIKKAHNIYCVSEYAAKCISDCYGIKPCVLENAVEDSYHDFISNTNNKINLLLLGTIEPRKRIDFLINSIKLLPQFYQNKITLNFAGGIPNQQCMEYFNSFKDYIDNNTINYLNEIRSYDEKINLYNKSDVVIVPSSDESCSLVVLEATMMAKPVIVSENVGAKYMIDSLNGWIFETDNSESLNTILKDIVDKKFDLGKMGKSSREKYIKLASMPVYKKKVINLVKKYLSNYKTLEEY